MKDEKKESNTTKWTPEKQKQFNEEFAKEYDELIQMCDIEILWWRKYLRRNRRSQGDREQANTFIGREVEERERWIRLKKQYLNIG